MKKIVIIQRQNPTNPMYRKRKKKEFDSCTYFCLDTPKIFKIHNNIFSSIRYPIFKEYKRNQVQPNLEKIV